MASRLSRAEISPTERGLRSRIAQIASGERLLRGTLSERSSKCGKPNCRCADGAGHSSLYLVQSQAGKVRQLCIPKALQYPVRQAVGQFQEMQRLLHEVSELEWRRFLARKG
jgi:hypothetical protein